MKFGQQFEYHKIPEWYNMYLDYQMFKENADHFKKQVEDGELTPIEEEWRFEPEEFTNSWNLIKKDLKDDEDGDVH